MASNTIEVEPQVEEACIPDVELEPSSEGTIDISVWKRDAECDGKDMILGAKSHIYPSPPLAINPVVFTEIDTVVVLWRCLPKSLNQ